ncbi:MAG: ABC transporter ATP-binding protein [Spirochaetes bacterium]|uniref:ABC transporter ATP-binding protein n=1 Tax=Candidatus Ornithospirochaeta stercoripullorum TaxID=2840899 RepID=A0A9D9DY23_9SPIO|nr:ABC transporter ATP-binding protein [Candidatus Ornithospirochaeta stercoripullorum]
MESVLQINHLSLILNGRKILNDVSMTLERGSFAAMCGRNGAGKSQLLRCLKGLRKPDTGEILIDNCKADEKTRMKRIALVFQNAEMQIVSQSVEKDIAFGPENMGLEKDEAERRVKKALSLMGLTDKAKQRPQTLSGGELRKCAIAGILAMEPDVILLDEPFANLDYPSTLTVIKALISLHEKGYTILVVSHEAEKFLAHTDTLLIMDNGSIKEAGTSSQIFEKLAHYDIYLPEKSSFEELTWLKR